MCVQLPVGTCFVKNHILYVCVERDHSQMACEGCAFVSNPCCVYDLHLSCYNGVRYDGKDVIFKEVGEV